MERLDPQRDTNSAYINGNDARVAQSLADSARSTRIAAEKAEKLSKMPKREDYKDGPDGNQEFLKAYYKMSDEIRDMNGGKRTRNRRMRSRQTRRTRSKKSRRRR